MKKDILQLRVHERSLAAGIERCRNKFYWHVLGEMIRGQPEAKKKQRAQLR